MVTVKSYQQKETADGKKFLVLELEGGLQIQTSQNSGKLYASVAKCTIACTFDEMTARQMIGTSLPGTIVRIPCEPYSYVNPQTKETMILNFRYGYKPPSDPRVTSLELQAREEVDIETP